MGVTKYVADGRTWWRVDEWVAGPDGLPHRYRKKRIPTKELAVALAAKALSESFEGRFFDRREASSLTVTEAWELYEPARKRDLRGWLTDKGRVAHLLRHLGSRLAASLSFADVELYRGKRLAEKTVRARKPSSATLDREVELLKRLLNNAVLQGKMDTNPVAAAPLLREPNVRRTVLDDETFKRLLDACEPALKPIVQVAYDTGMRLREILDLVWQQVDLTHGEITLAPQDTKTEQPRIIPITAGVLATMSAMPRGLPATPVFRNPATGKPWQDIRKMFNWAKKKAGIADLWFHDLRRSFVTRARRLGIAESVVMKLSGHKTRAVFDRYNIVEMKDLREAARLLEARTLSGHSNSDGPQKAEDPAG